MVANTKTRNRSANGGTHASQIDFSVDFTIPNPDDISTMKSKIVFPDEDETDEFSDDEEVDVGTRVLRWRKRELERELQQIKKIEQARDQEEPLDDEDDSEDDPDDDSDDFDRRRLPPRRSH